MEIIGFRFHSDYFHYSNKISFSFINWRLLDFIIHLQWRFHGINYHWLFQLNSKSFSQITWSSSSYCHLTECWCYMIISQKITSFCYRYYYLTKLSQHYDFIHQLLLIKKFIWKVVYNDKEKVHFDHLLSIIRNTISEDEKGISLFLEFIDFQFVQINDEISQNYNQIHFVYWFFHLSIIQFHQIN